jgi:hypothetical protein
MVHSSHLFSLIEHPSPTLPSTTFAPPSTQDLSSTLIPFIPLAYTFNPSSLLLHLCHFPSAPANHQMNPHFAFSAIFALGLRGIANKSKLPYGPINSPGVTRETLIKLPTSLESATAQFKRKESLAREVMGDYFVDHFAGTREHELEVFRRAVTDWEGKSFSFFPCLPLHPLLPLVPCPPPCPILAASALGHPSSISSSRPTRFFPSQRIWG